MTLTALLLAGGLSRRMGSDKATLEFGGEPLWKRQLRILRGLAPASLCVSARSRPLWCPADVEVWVDEPPSHGPLTGLVAGLSRLQTTHLLVLAVDLPRITEAHLLMLWSLAIDGHGVIPWNGTYFEPLCAIYPVEAASIAREALSVGELSLQELAKNLTSEGMALRYILQPGERDLYLNLNRPSDRLAPATWEGVEK